VQLAHSILNEGPALNVAEFAARFAARKWVAKLQHRDAHGNTLLEAATQHAAPAAVLELLHEAAAAPLTTTTLAGDQLCIHGWDDDWIAPGANLAAALIAENPQAMAGVFVDEMEPVTLNPTTMGLSPVLFRPLTALDVEVAGVATGGGASSRTVRVQLALDGGTVGYARHKIGVEAGTRGESASGGEGGGTHAGRLWLVRGGDGKRASKQKLPRSADEEVLQTVLGFGAGAGVGAGAGGGTESKASLLYERHRTWKGLFKFAPRHERTSGGAGTETDAYGGNRGIRGAHDATTCAR
jgi:hypothetical protein